MLSLSLLVQQMQLQLAEIQRRLDAGEGTSTQTGSTTPSAETVSSFDLSNIKVRPRIFYTDEYPTVELEQEDNNIFFKFTLPRPIDSAERFGVIVAETMTEDRVQVVPLKTSEIKSIPLNDKPVFPVIVFVGGYSYVEAYKDSPRSAVAPFIVDRENKKILWYSTNARRALKNDLAECAFILYKVAVTTETVRHRIDISTLITNNSFTLPSVPTNDEVTIIINGIYYHEKTDIYLPGTSVARRQFMVQRTTTPAVIYWNSDVTGFSLNSNLTGYIDVLYKIQIDI